MALPFAVLLTFLANGVCYSVYEIHDTKKNDLEAPLLLEKAVDSLSVGVSELNREFAICVWFEITRTTVDSVVFSIMDGRANVLHLILEYRFPRLQWIYDPAVYKSLWTEIMIPPYKWNHSCFIKGRKNQLEMYLNGERAQSHVDDAEVFSKNCTIVVGQALKKKHLGSSSLIGKISELNIWTSQLIEKDVENLYACESIEVDPAIKWEEAQWREHGEVTKTDEPICEKTTEEVFFFPLKVGYNLASSFCSSQGLSMYLPSNNTEPGLYVQDLYKVSECASVMNMPSFWIRIVFNGTLQQWMDNGRVVNSSLLISGRRTISQNIDLGTLLTSEGKLISLQLFETRACAACQGLPSKPLFMFGLCQGEREILVYNAFFPSVSSAVHLPTMGNMYGLEIKIQGEAWVIFDTVSDFTIAKRDSLSFPYGIHLWDIVILPNFCKNFGLNKPSNSSVTLTLTSCLNDEMTCNNGECVSMDKRCDSNVDCEDQSDEAGCTPRTNVAPEFQDAQPEIPLMINVTLAQVVKISSVSSLAGTMQVELSLSLAWFDPRLSFRNLHPHKHTNVLGAQKPWTPTIEILNEDRLQGFVDPQTSVVAIRRKNFNARVGNDHLYRGADNPLEMSYHGFHYTSCLFVMNLYPFDQQLCYIRAKIANVENETLQVSKSSESQMPYRETVAEYDVDFDEFYIDGNELVLRISLTRTPSGKLLSIYFPTILLHILGYGTLFIDPEDFQDRGSMSLTLMLVLISLFASESAILPKTAYVKWIDIWFLLSIVYLAVIIGIHLITSNPGDTFFRAPREVHPSSQSKKKLNLSFSRKQLYQRILDTSKIALALLYIVLQIFYWYWIVAKYLFY